MTETEAIKVLIYLFLDAQLDKERIDIDGESWNDQSGWSVFMPSKSQYRRYWCTR